MRAAFAQVDQRHFEMVEGKPSISTSPPVMIAR
jgi:hypothetical protein